MALFPAQVSPICLRFSPPPPLDETPELQPVSSLSAVNRFSDKTTLVSGNGGAGWLGGQNQRTDPVS